VEEVNEEYELAKKIEGQKG